VEVSEVAKLPFVQVASPIMITFVAAAWNQNKRLDDILKRLDRIEHKLENHNDRNTRLEERTSPFAGVRR
jgi:hypothetical protein